MCSGAFPAIGGLPGVRQASIAALWRPTGLPGTRGTGGAVCRIAAAQRRADVREGVAQHQSLDEKGAMVPALACSWKRFWPIRGVNPTFRSGQSSVGGVTREYAGRLEGCTSRLHFWHCGGAQVLPGSTFGAFVSGYFSNPTIWRPFGQGLAESPPNRVLKGPQKFLTNAFSWWRAYCQ